MRAYVLLYTRDGDEKSNAFVIEVRSVNHAIETIPQLVKRHLARPHNDCQFDRWTVSVKNKATNLYRIAATGELVNGQPAEPHAGTDGMASNATPRED